MIKVKVNREQLLNNVTNIPTELMALDKWCAYYNDKDGYLDKKPISLVTGRAGIKSDSDDKLVSFDKAKEKLNEGKVAVLGVGITPEIGIIFIDLDFHNPELREKYNEIKIVILEKFKGYAEKSASDIGTHLAIKGKIPPGYNYRDKYGIIEVFDNRFIITTGNIIEGRSREIIEQQEALDWLCETYLSKTNLRELALVPTAESTKTDQEIIGKVKEFQKGKHFLSGQYDQITKKDKETGEVIQAYPSKSEADLAFCNLILYLNGNDKSQAIRIFKESVMAKGLEKKSSGYLQHQMSVASLSLQKTYDWSMPLDKAEQIVEVQEVDIVATTQSLMDRVAEYGFEVTNSDKLNEFAAKYILNFGVAAKEVVDTSLGDFDSAGNGKRFYYIMKNQHIYNPKANEWAIWDGKNWSRCYDNDLLGATELVFNNLKHEAFMLVMQSVYELDKDKKTKLEWMQ